MSDEVVHSSDLQRYWYVAAFQDLEAGAALSALAGCEGTPPLPMVKFKRTMIMARDMESAYDIGGVWKDESFPDELFINDYAFLATDFLQEVKEL